MCTATTRAWVAWQARMKFVAVLGGDEAKQQHLLLSQPHDKHGFIKGSRVLATVHVQKVE